jgi:putative endonuclease
MPKQPAVYILASQRNGTLYVGVTSDLVQRVWRHRNHEVEGFTKRYDVDRLVHFELFDDMLAAIEREKQLKKWKRAWKMELIESHNPEWRICGIRLFKEYCYLIGWIPAYAGMTKSRRPRESGDPESVRRKDCRAYAGITKLHTTSLSGSFPHEQFLLGASSFPRASAAVASRGRIAEDGNQLSRVYHGQVRDRSGGIPC